MRKYIFLTFLLLISKTFQAQTYCLTISTVENGLNVTFNWSITSNPSQTISASIDIIGSGTLNGNTTQTVGGFGSSSYSGSFNWTRSGLGSYSYTTDDSSPLGVITSAFVRLSFSCTSLPITLSTFSATKHSDRSSKLDWTTSSEINSDYFGIERSRDGDTWETISQVAAAGNSSEVKYYEYIDDKLPFSRSKDQIFYYRLRLTDQDGSFKYSDIKGVNFNRQTADGVIAVYPNPATQMVHIDIAGMDESQGETKLRIFDMYGRVMSTRPSLAAAWSR